MTDEKNVTNGQDVAKVEEIATNATSTKEVKSRNSRVDAAKKSLDESLNKVLKNNSNNEALRIIFDNIIAALPDNSVDYDTLSIDKLIEAKSELTNKIKEIDAAITARAKSANK